MSDKFKIWYLYATLFITGAVILVIEIAGTRVLAPFYGSTIFVWSSLITVTLGALALGYFVGGLIADKYPKAQWFYFVIFVGGFAALLLLKFSNPILIFSDNFGIRWGAFIATFLLFALPLFLLSMAGPFAIRLLAREREHAGHVSGAIFGVSTAGSLAGALITGFYLIPNFFIETIFSAATGAVMAMAIIGFFLESRSLPKALFAACFALIAYFIPFFAPIAGEAALLHREPSFYGDIRVVERGGFRCMSIEGSIQSCMQLSTGGNALPYIGLMETLLKYAEGDLLVVGLGGGMIPRDMREHFDTIDVIDIDPKVRKIAGEFFSYDDSHPSLTTYITDGRAFLRQNAKKYDAIALDVFAGSNLAPYLFTKEAFEVMRAALAPGGVLVINTTGRPYREGSELPRSIFKTLNTAFPYLGVLSTENVKNNSEKFGNLIFVASGEPKEFPISEDFIVAYDTGDINDVQLFTDARNHIDAVGAPVYEESQKFHRALLGTL